MSMTSTEYNATFKNLENKKTKLNTELRDKIIKLAELYPDVDMKIRNIYYGTKFWSMDVLKEFTTAELLIFLKQFEDHVASKSKQVSLAL